MPLQRLRQVTAAISLRKFREAREENQRFSWMTRTLATYIAAGYMVEGKNPYLERAATLAMDEVEQVLLNGAAEAQAAEPQQGSFEKLMRFAGSMQAKP